MKAATLNELKKEITSLSKEDLINLCLRIAKYKKENKELLTYLLFNAGNEQEYVHAITEELEGEFKTINSSSLYFAKKTIRRILRIVKKYIKYSGNKETEVEVLIFYLEQLKKTGLPIKESKVLMNLYQRQIDSIKKAKSNLHEDLQFDYKERITSLTL